MGAFGASPALGDDRALAHAAIPSHEPTAGNTLAIAGCSPGSLLGRLNRAGGGRSWKRLTSAEFCDVLDNQLKRLIIGSGIRTNGTND
jgi:hypothetical protein